jgi:hypothetical protein
MSPRISVESSRPSRSKSLGCGLDAPTAKLDDVGDQSIERIWYEPSGS